MYGYFSEWSVSGVWEEIEHVFSRVARLLAGRTLEPSFAIIDSQSVRNQYGEERGYDGFKKVRGRKRHILVDTFGFLIAVDVQSANMRDPHGGVLVLRKISEPYLKSIQTVLADRAYVGPFDAILEFNFEKRLILTNYAKDGTTLKPLRWIVERTFAWFNNFRRLARDYERKTCHSEAMLFLSMTRMLLARLTAS